MTEVTTEDIVTKCSEFPTGPVFGPELRPPPLEVTPVRSRGWVMTDSVGGAGVLNFTKLSLCFTLFTKIWLGWMWTIMSLLS